MVVAVVPNARNDDFVDNVSDSVSRRGGGFHTVASAVATGLLSIDTMVGKHEQESDDGGNNVSDLHGSFCRSCGA
jgi:hypothetical protein